MTKFCEWCYETETIIATHSLKVLSADASKLEHAVELLTDTIPSHYASLTRTESIFARLGRSAVSKYIKDKLPTQLNIQSGDLAEILCSNYVTENTLFKSGIKRLRHKDHKNMAMRGEDVLAFTLGNQGQLTGILKAEVKSRSKLSSTVIREAREALTANNGKPSAHALLFVADKASDEGDTKLSDAIEDYTLNGNDSNVTVTHMFFTLCGNNPTTLIETNLKTHKGTIAQQDVGVHVQEHQDFVRSVFNALSL